MKQRILLTVGDPCGIGPEIAIKILASRLSEKYEFKVISPFKVLEFYSGLLNIKKINPDNIINIPGYDTFKITPGKSSALSGRISGDSIRIAADLCREKEFDAMITLPISKEALNCGGYSFPGHTEMLKFYTRSKTSFMIMCFGKLKIANATNHVPVKKLSSVLNRKFIISRLISLNNILVSEFKIIKPRIAVLSFNPHNGDGGLIGKEEQKYIIPAIMNLKSEGLNISGTFAADSYFSNQTYNDFDATLSLYHDQGLIPFKIISGNKGVNYTGGLNIIRTSPDHGTAFDIAGRGIADIESTVNAIGFADKLIRGKNK